MDEPRPLSRDRVGPPARTEFDAIYAGSPPWDIGRPQPAFVTLADQGRLAGRVLDAGCGTGEHTLMAARRGHTSVGVDIAPTAIALAEAKLTATTHDGAGLPATFHVGDVLDLPALSLGQFDTVLDSGVFHVFDDAERPRYVAGLHAVLNPGAHLLLLCFSEHEPGAWGPRRVTRQELHAAFATAWTIESITPNTFDVRRPPTDAPRAQAWLAQIRRT
jgi:SAM-dependent methyltransferase